MVEGKSDFYLLRYYEEVIQGRGPKDRLRFMPGGGAGTLDEVNSTLYWMGTGHETPAQQALALLAGLSDTEANDLDARASNRRVGTILKVMRELADDLKAGGSPPDSGELHAIAREALRNEYPPKRP